VHRTRVLVVDDHDVVRRGLCQIIASVPEFDIVGETASGEDAVEKAQEHLPDIAYGASRAESSMSVKLSPLRETLTYLLPSQWPSNS
jgi:DNA-binding NarL/FixJ family response regulator